jgi:hypothetical protein
MKQAPVQKSFDDARVTVVGGGPPPSKDRVVELQTRDGTVCTSLLTLAAAPLGSPLAAIAQLASQSTGDRYFVDLRSKHLLLMLDWLTMRVIGRRRCEWDVPYLDTPVGVLRAACLRMGMLDMAAEVDDMYDPPLVVCVPKNPWCLADGALRDDHSLVRMEFRGRETLLDMVEKVMRVGAAPRDIMANQGDRPALAHGKAQHKKRHRKFERRSQPDSDSSDYSDCEHCDMPTQLVLRAVLFARDLNDRAFVPFAIAALSDETPMSRHHSTLNGFLDGLTPAEQREAPIAVALCYVEDKVAVSTFSFRPRRPLQVETSVRSGWLRYNNGNHALVAVHHWDEATGTLAPPQWHYARDSQKGLVGSTWPRLSTSYRIFPSHETPTLWETGFLKGDVTRPIARHHTQCNGALAVQHFVVAAASAEEIVAALYADEPQTAASTGSQPVQTANTTTS